MSNIWSTYIQGIETLYSTRSLRFSDFFRDKYQSFFSIEDSEDKKKILEIGCGPGALSEALFRWYPNTQIFGIDRDSNFIEFARRKNSYIHFEEGDAASLSFQDESFDVTISNTVAEHIEPSQFYSEQYRVLKQNGICLVLSARKGINIEAPCIAEQSEFERDIWQRTEKIFADMVKKYNVCAYPQSEMEMPLLMERHGFKDVTTEYITVNLTPDNPIYTKEMAYAMINANKHSDFESADVLLRVAPEVVTKEEIEELKRQIDEKYKKRIELYDRGIKQWDTNVSITMILRGIK